jgi:Quinohemoprotein amine dehydrogenase, alpha subunit domain III
MTAGKRSLVAVSITVLFAGLAFLPASSASSSGRSPRVGTIGGIVPSRAVSGSVAEAGGQGTPPLTYHGGPIMKTNKTYAIYWVPSGFSVSGQYKTLIDQFFGDVAAASGSTSNVYASDTQYYDTTNGNIQYNSTFGASYLDTQALPASGCNDGVSQTTACLTDSQLTTEIQRVAALKGWTINSSSMFFMFTASGIGSCFDSGGSECAFTTYCAYHGSVGSGSNALIYANQPYTMTVPSACDAGEHPNGDDADPTINVTSHEHNEAITDPQLTAWYDAAGYENGDECAWDFGTVLGGSSGSKDNQVINTRHYYLQQEYSNADATCVQTYGTAVVPPTVTSVAPPSAALGAKNVAVTLLGTGFVNGATVSFGDPAITINAVSFTNSGQLVATVRVRSAAMPGAHTVTVTNPAGGGSGSCVGCFMVTGGNPPPTVTSASPSTLSRGASGVTVNIVGTNFVTGATVSFGDGAVKVSSTTFSNSGTLILTMKIKGGATVGAHTITVTNPSGATATCVGCFTVT